MRKWEDTDPQFQQYAIQTIYEDMLGFERQVGLVRDNRLANLPILLSRMELALEAHKTAILFLTGEEGPDEWEKVDPTRREVLFERTLRMRQTVDAYAVDAVNNQMSLVAYRYVSCADALESAVMFLGYKYPETLAEFVANETKSGWSVVKKDGVNVMHAVFDKKENVNDK